MVLAAKSTTSNIDIQNIVLKKFKLYKLRFYGIAQKSINPQIEKIWIQDESKFKSILIWGTAKLGGTYIDVYIFPIENPIPIAVLLGTSAVLAALGLTLAILYKIEDISGIVYIALGIIVFFAITKNKEIKKVLKL